MKQNTETIAKRVATQKKRKHPWRTRFDFSNPYSRKRYPQSYVNL